MQSHGKKLFAEAVAGAGGGYHAGYDIGVFRRGESGRATGYIKGAAGGGTYSTRASQSHRRLQDAYTFLAALCGLGTVLPTLSTSQLCLHLGRFLELQLLPQIPHSQTFAFCLAAPGRTAPCQSFPSFAAVHQVALPARPVECHSRDTLAPCADSCGTWAGHGHTLSFGLCKG